MAVDGSIFGVQISAALHFSCLPSFLIRLRMLLIDFVSSSSNFFSVFVDNKNWVWYLFVTDVVSPTSGFRRKPLASALSLPLFLLFLFLVFSLLRFFSDSFFRNHFFFPKTSCQRRPGANTVPLTMVTFFKKHVFYSLSLPLRCLVF